MSEPNHIPNESSHVMDPNAWPGFEVSLRSHENAPRQALKKVLEGLKPLNLEIEELMTVELVLAEALNNIIEHAYPENAIEGPIDISCRRQADGLHVNIHDKGYPMPDGVAPIGQRPDVDVEMDDLPEGGFGWFLIKDLARDVEYRRIGDENSLKLRIAVAFGQTSH